MRLSILIYDGFTSLDFIGGYEVLSRIPGMETEFFASEKGLIAADTRRLGIAAWKSFDEVQSTDILYVPGGPGGLALENNNEALSKIRTLDETSTWTVGICNGVAILGAAGLLKGKTATTNWFHRDRLSGFGATFVQERFHRDGKYVTGAGVSASIDAGLFLAREIAGEEAAKTLQLGIEYYPAPPFPEASPEEAPEYAHQLVAAFEENGGAGQMAQRAPFETLFTTK